MDVALLLSPTPHDLERTTPRLMLTPLRAASILVLAVQGPVTMASGHDGDKQQFNYLWCVCVLCGTKEDFAQAATLLDSWSRFGALNRRGLCSVDKRLAIKCVVWQLVHWVVIFDAARRKLRQSMYPHPPVTSSPNRTPLRSGLRHKLLTRYRLAVWCSGSALTSINEVILRRARLVLGWVNSQGLNSRCTDLSK